jgi:hypothetical protein
MGVIDQEWIRRELERVMADLSGVFPDATAEDVAAAVDAAADELVPSARVMTYLPILVRRRAYARMTRIVHTVGVRR